MNKILLDILLAFLFLNYNLFSQGWEELASLASPNPFAVMASANGKLYLLSGTQGGPAKTYEYNPDEKENGWLEKTPIPQGCIYGTAVECNGKIYVMGGGQSNQKKSYNFIYDPVLDSYTTGDTLLTPRMYHSAAQAGGKIYLIGGQNGDGTTEWYFDEYNPDNNTWSRKSQLLHNQAWYCGAAGIGDKFYRIAGGKWNGPTNYFEEYDTKTDIWSELPPFPITLHAPSAVSFQGKIMVFGGINSEESIDSVYTYYPSTGNWILSFRRLPMPMNLTHKTAVIGDYVYLYYKPEGSPSGILWRYKFGTTGVEEFPNNDENNISIFPNPSSGNYNIGFNSEINSGIKIEIINTLGSIIQQIELPLNGDKIINITMTEYSKGLYFVRISKDGNTLVKKVVLN